MTDIHTLEAGLDSFSGRERAAVLRKLAAEHLAAVPPAGANVNMHCHSFFSFNAQGMSPSRVAWEARKAGLYAAGLCDFDVLDGLEEFIEAGLLLGLRATVNLETRAFLREYAQADINSPGEPGVTYIMGAGFAAVPLTSSPQGRTLIAYRRQAAARNLALVRRINEHLPEIAVDYEHDVLPLAPAHAPTERHIVRAYCRKAAVVHPGDALAPFWARVLQLPPDKVAPILGDTAKLEDRVRSRLAKRGGLGYEQPTPATFPPVDDFIAWVLSCEAIPMATWLDGTSEGERDPAAMLECLRAKGAAAVNIIPDRNWNLADPAQRDLKQARLREFVDTAVRMDLPVNIGTELNKEGLPFVDDLAAPALRPFGEEFRRGARIMVGHTLLLRYGGFSYAGKAAEARFGRSTAEKNRFFEAVGALPPLTADRAARLADAGPEAAFARLSDSVAASTWTL